MDVASIRCQSDALRTRKTASSVRLGGDLSAEERAQLEQEVVLCTRALVALERIERSLAEEAASVAGDGSSVVYLAETTNTEALEDGHGERVYE